MPQHLPTPTESSATEPEHPTEALRRVLEGHTWEVLNALDEEGTRTRDIVVAATNILGDNVYEQRALVIAIATEVAEVMRDGLADILAAVTEPRGPLDDLARWCVRIETAPFADNVADDLRNAIGGLSWPIRNGHLRRDLVAARIADAATARGMGRTEALGIVTAALDGVRSS